MYLNCKLKFLKLLNLFINSGSKEDDEVIDLDNDDYDSNSNNRSTKNKKKRRWKKLFKIGKIESKVCAVCESGTEDLFHLFLECKELQDFKKNFVIYHLKSFLKDCENSVYNTLNFENISKRFFNET